MTEQVTEVAEVEVLRQQVADLQQRNRDLEREVHEAHSRMGREVAGLRGRLREVRAHLNRQTSTHRALMQVLSEAVGFSVRDHKDPEVASAYEIEAKFKEMRRVCVDPVRHGRREAMERVHDFLFKHDLLRHLSREQDNEWEQIHEWSYRGTFVDREAEAD